MSPSADRPPLLLTVCHHCAPPCSDSFSSRGYTMQICCSISFCSSAVALRSLRKQTGTCHAQLGESLLEKLLGADSMAQYTAVWHRSPRQYNPPSAQHSKGHCQLKISSIRARHKDPLHRKVWRKDQQNQHSCSDASSNRPCTAHAEACILRGAMPQAPSPRSTPVREAAAVACQEACLWEPPLPP